MHKKIVLLIGIVLIFGAFTFSIQKFKPIGTWKAKDDKGRISHIEFKEDGKLRFKSDTDNFLPNDVALRYNFNYDKKPVWCDIIIYSLSGDKIGSMEGIADIKSKNNFILKISPKSRPKTFDDKEGETIEFTRIK